MKRVKDGAAFFDQLRSIVKRLRKMKPGEVHVLSINANYGHYQISIGPTPAESPELKGTKADEPRGPIEINGEIHHLFLSPDAVRAMPSEKQVIENMKDTVIMRDLSIHMKDSSGDGNHLDHANDGEAVMKARECINLAGEEGQRLMEEAKNEMRIHLATYHLVQQDILKALQSSHRDEESTLDID